MPTFAIESPQTGQKYQVQFDREPSPEDLDFAAKQFDNEWWQQQGIEPGSAITQQTPLETVGNASFGGLGRVATQAVSGLAKLADVGGAQSFQSITGLPLSTGLQNLAKQADAITDESRRVYPMNPANPKASTLGEGAAQALGMLAPAGAARMLGAGAEIMTAVPATMGFAMGAGSGIDTGREMGLSPLGQMNMGLAFGAAESATEMLGGVGGRFLPPAQSLIGKALTGAASEAIEEPASGMLTEAITNVAAIPVADPQRPGFTTTGFQIPGPQGYLDRRGMEALGGLAGGIVFAGAQLAAGNGVGQPLSEAPASAPDAVPESTGDLTAADVAEFEARVDGDGSMVDGQNPAPTPRKPILQNVPDRMGRMRESSLNEEPLTEGDVITDLRVPRSPAAIAESQRIEQERLAQVAKVPASVSQAETAIQDWDRQNKNKQGNLWFEDAHGNTAVTDAMNRASTNGGADLATHGMAKRGTLTQTMRDLLDLLKNGTNPNKNGGVLHTAPLAVPAGSAGAHAGTTASGTSYRDGPFILVNSVSASRTQVGIRDMGTVAAVLVNDANLAQLEAIRALISSIRPDIIVDLYSNADQVAATLTGKAKNAQSAPASAYPSLPVSESPSLVSPEVKQRTSRGGLLVDEYQPRGSAASTPATGPARAPSPAMAPARGEVNLEDLNAELQMAGGFHSFTVDGTTAGFANAQILNEALDLVKQGFNTFANWSQAMVTRFGRGIQEFLAAIWQQIMSPQTNAAQNVRLGMPQGTAPVSMGQGGFVGGDRASNIPEGQAVVVAAQANEPSPGGLSEAEARRKLEALKKERQRRYDLTKQFPKKQRIATNPAYAQALSFAHEGSTAVDEFYERHPELRPVVNHGTGRVRENLPASDDSEIEEVTEEMTNEQRRTQDRGAAYDLVLEMRGKIRPLKSEQYQSVTLRSFDASAKSDSLYLHFSLTPTPEYFKKVQQWTEDELWEAGLPRDLGDMDAGYTPEDATIPFTVRISDHPTPASSRTETDYDVIVDDGTAWSRGNNWYKGNGEARTFAGAVQNLFSLPGIQKQLGLKQQTPTVASEGSVPVGTLTVADQNAPKTTPSSPEVNPESSRAADLNAELQMAGGFHSFTVDGTTAGFANAQILNEALDLVKQGFNTFANWSQAMVTRFGRGIQEFLAAIWQQIMSPQTNAAQNVRLGMPQGTAPVSMGQGGFVGGDRASNIPEGQDVTRSRFASPDEAANLYDVQATETMRGESAAWIEANGLDAALAALESNTPPAGLRIDHLPSLGAQLITRLSKLADTGTEAQRLQADAMLDRAGAAWHGKASQEAGRTLQQRAMANQELAAIAPILAAKQVLTDRADRVMKERFEGGAEGAVEKVKDIDTKASTQAGEELAADLEVETAAKPNKGGNAIPPSERAKPAARSGRITAKHPNLKKLLDALRKKVAPGMTWAEIFMTLPAEQKARQKEIYRRLMLDERLKALNQGERLQLTNELDRAWQRERRKVFLRELEKITGLGKALKDKKDKAKVKAALPRLLRLMNLGMLNSETFRGALAQEYGLKQIDAATGAELRKLGEAIQQAPEGLPRRKLEQQLMQRLQNLTGSTMAEILESWWTASVLSGWRTQMDIALGLANGLEDVTLGSLVTAMRTGNGRVVKDALFAMLSNLPTAMNEALDHLLTGNRAAMRSYDAEVKAALEDGNKLFGNVGRQLLNKGGMARLPGAFMEFVSRMMTALDHINSTSTYEGAKAMAMARHPEIYEKALSISTEDRQAARTQARLELTAGATPTTRQQRVEEDARVKEILDQRVPVEFQAQAREIGLEAALQGEPTGLGWFIYQVANKINTTMRQAEAAYDKSRPDNAAGKAVMLGLRLASTLAKVLTGTKFVRTVGHSVNRSLSYAPGIGLVRFAEGNMKGAKADILLAKQLLGTAMGLALLAAFRDGEDDEQGIEGSWRDLTPQQKGQLLAEGKQPYSVWSRDAAGRIRTWSYQQWGLAGVMATIGGMEDARRYNSQGKDDLAILMDGIVSGAMAWTDKTQLTGLQMLMAKDQAATSSPSASLAGALNKWASTTAGGLVPRIFKDVDMVISPQLRDSSEWWMKWAAQVPMVRELSSGKRVNIFGEDIVLDRGPTSRVTQVGVIDPALRTLGRLNERDIWLPDPTQGLRMVKLSDGSRRKMSMLEKDRYQRATGAAYKKFITENGAALLRLEPDAARELISKVTQRLRAQAANEAVRR